MLVMLLTPVRQLQQLGYRAVAYGFFEEDVQVAHTDDCACCAAPGVFQYIHAVTVAGEAHICCS